MVIKQCRTLDDYRNLIQEDQGEAALLCQEFLVASPISSAICRNMLIYMAPTVLSQILAGFGFSLKPKGALFLGASEDIERGMARFSPVNSRWRILSNIGVRTGRYAARSAAAFHQPRIDWRPSRRPCSWTRTCASAGSAGRSRANRHACPAVISTSRISRSASRQPWRRRGGARQSALSQSPEGRSDSSRHRHAGHGRFQLRRRL